jgi:hypothetical protein
VGDSDGLAGVNGVGSWLAGADNGITGADWEWDVARFFNATLIQGLMADARGVEGEKWHFLINHDLS